VVLAADPVPTLRCRIVIPVTTGDSTIVSEAFFTVDGDSYLPSVMARGPWGAAMGGQIVGGLLGWGIEQSGVDPDLQPARLTVDLLRPALLEPVQIQTSVQREGRRIKLVDGALVQNGKTVARASALFLRRSEHPDGEVWTAPVRMPPLPTDSDEFPADIPFFIWGYGANPEKGTRGMTEWEQSHTQKFAWTRVFRPMVQGHRSHRLVDWHSSVISQVRSPIGALADCVISTPTTRSLGADCRTVNTSGWQPKATTAQPVWQLAERPCSIGTGRSAPVRRWLWPNPPMRSTRPSRLKCDSASKID
jgi:hypothetical protein